MQDVATLMMQLSGENVEVADEEEEEVEEEKLYIETDYEINTPG